MMRFLPSLIFLYLALLWGNIFWLVTIILWLEAIVEIIFRYWRGYLTLNENQIQKHLLFVTDKLSIDEINEVFVYGNEWTFTSKKGLFEIKLIKNYISKSRQKQLDEILDEFWSNIRKTKNSGFSPS